MSAEWNKDYNPEHLTKRLEESKLKDQNGKVSFQGFGFSEYIVVLNSMVSFNSEIPELEKRKIVYQAAFDVSKEGRITSETLLNEIKTLEKKYLQKRPQQYVLITSLSIDRFCKLKRLSVNGCIITFHSFTPEKFQKEIKDKIQRHASHSILGKFPDNYICVKISVMGKSHSEAVDKALDAIDTIRGIWNLFYNRGKTSSGERKSVNNIVLGPLHTLHLSSGKLATESWWYETSYCGPLKTYDIKNRENFYKFQSNVRKFLRKSNYTEFLESSLMRYARALDLRDWENAFLRLWGLLESLTNTSENDSHKVTVRRTSFLFKERKYAQQVLTHLRAYRNKAVHAGEGNHSIETFMYQLKNFVEAVLEFQIANKFGFKSREEITQFLDLADDKTVLNRKVEIMKYARDFL